MDNKGYVYTLIVMMLVLIVISLVSYYIIISKPVISDALSKMRTDEMYYFVESVKMDYSRSVSIAGQRSFTYLIDYSIKNDEVFYDYEMHNCTQLNYGLNGSQAAAVELMLCGTLEGNAMLPRDFMENHTLLEWSNRVSSKGDEINFIVDVKPRDIEIIPYDPWNFYILSKLDLTVHDKSNKSLYRGYGIPVVSKISIDFMEDPLYSFETGSHGLIRYFTPCNTSDLVNATTIEMWLDTECYLESSSGPSFFDRLDGNLSIGEKYVEQSEKVEELSLKQQAIGLESFVDLDRFAYYGVTAEYNKSWVDHYYWKNVPAYCSVMHMEDHKNFKIDFEHAMEYYISDLECSVLADGAEFTPSTLTLPVNSTVTWTNTNLGDSCLLNVNANGCCSKELIHGESFSWMFNETGNYGMSCTLLLSGNSFTGNVYIMTK